MEARFIDILPKVLLGGLYSAHHAIQEHVHCQVFFLFLSFTGDKTAS